jgi:hypothetical protein
MATMGVNRRKAIRPPDGSPSNSIISPTKGEGFATSGSLWRSVHACLRQQPGVEANPFTAAAVKEAPPLHQGQKFERNFSRDYLVHPTHPIGPLTWPRLGQNYPTYDHCRHSDSRRRFLDKPSYVQNLLPSQRQRERQPLGDTALE